MPMWIIVFVAAVLVLLMVAIVRRDRARGSSGSGGVDAGGWIDPSAEPQHHHGSHDGGGHDGGHAGGGDAGGHH